MRAIRKTMWRAEAYRRAGNSLSSQALRKAGGDEADVEAALLVKAEQNYKLMNNSWYPDFWLAFAMYSIPAREHLLLSLNGAKPGFARIDPLATASQVASRGGIGLNSSHQSPNTQIRAAGKRSLGDSRAVRKEKATAGLISQHSGLQSTLGAEPPLKSVAIVHTHIVSSGARDPHESKIQNQQKLVDLLTKQCSRGLHKEEELEEEENRLIDLLRSN